MKLDFRKLSLALALPLAIGFASCGDDNDKPDPKDLVQAEMKGDPFVYVQYNNGTDQVFNSTHDTDLYVTFNRLTRKADLEFRNINFGDGTTSFSFTDVNYGLAPDGESFSISQPGLTASGGLAGKKLTLNLLYCGEKKINDEDCTGLSARVTIDGDRDITLIPRELIWAGTTETRNERSGGEAFVSYDTYYEVEIDPATSTATITVHKPKFSADMPTLGDMTFPGIKVKLRPGGFVLEAEELIPMIDNTPQPRRKITNLKADCDLFSTECMLEFNCMEVFKVYASVNPNFAE